MAEENGRTEKDDDDLGNDYREVIGKACNQNNYNIDFLKQPFNTHNFLQL